MLAQLRSIACSALRYCFVRFRSLTCSAPRPAVLLVQFRNQQTAKNLRVAFAFELLHASAEQRIQSLLATVPICLRSLRVASDNSSHNSFQSSGIRRVHKPFRFRDVKHKPVLYRPNDAKRADRLYKIMMAAAVAAIAIFVCCVFFEVRTVRASGSERYLGEEIVHYSGIENGEKMLFLNTRKAASNILSSLPYIKSVSIRRRFPSTVCIEVEERTPTAKIVNGNFAYIIDDEGYLLEYTAASSRFDLPVIICAAPTRLEEGKQLVFSDPLMLVTLQNVLSQIVKSEWIKNIDSINIERIYSISFLYQGRFDVKLGDTSDLDMKLRLLREVIARNSEDAYGTIDVSSTERVSFQPSR